MYKRSKLRKKYDKIFTYVRNSSLRHNTMIDLSLEEEERKKMGLTPIIYNGLSSLGKDKYNWYGYSADPLRDHLKTMADRIIIW